jgi:hypothetical protein
MIDPYQLDRLLDWMSRYRNDLKFIVTSVPFVAQFREPPEKAPDPTSTTRPGVEPNWYWRNQTSGSPDETRTSGPTDEIRNPANDKWSAKQFRGQRDRIIKHIADGRIEHVVFLAGDMHCCYHASMRIGVGSKYECITIHELAAGPVNQLQLATVDEFIPHYIGTAFGQRYEVVLDRFHGEINAVMHIKVSYDAKPPVKRSPDETVLPDLVPEIEWSVIRTLTDVGATAWVAPPPAVATSNDSPPTRLVAIKTKEDEPARWREPTMSGRIAFVRMRKPDELLPWDVQ